MKKIISTFLIVCTIVVYAQGIEKTRNWKEYITYQGVKIEYKYTSCDTYSVNNQVLVLSRFTNTTKDKVELSWNLERRRDGVCSNCKRPTSIEKLYDISFKFKPNCL